MDMGTSTMAMGLSSTATATAAAATASSTMTMSMGGSSSCKISMLWNWYTVDSCFIASSWHITSDGMFAGSCIGVILLVMSLEFLKRASREYDRAIILKAQQQRQTVSIATSPSKSASSEEPPRAPALAKSRPNIFQQAIRATFHMVQFAVAYFVMLLAMYYNGYIIICIIIGAWLGGFVFSWEALSLGSDSQEEATYCCG